MIRQSVLARKYVPVLITTPDVDPTGGLVHFAFISGPRDPADSDWIASTWDGPVDSPALPSSYIALCLVGPGGATALPKGDYTVWVTLSADPEAPVEQAGTLRIY